MARMGAAYPQADPGAAGLMHRALVRCPASEPASAALKLVQRKRARLLVVTRGKARGVLPPAVLKRARALGFGEFPAGDLAWWEVPTVSPLASEVTVRRRLMGGAPAVLVGAAGEPVGAVEASALTRPVFSLSLTPKLERQVPQAAIDVLRAAGELGAAMGMPVFAVGGFVRDLLLGRASLDLDVVAEGNGAALARRLARRIGGKVSIHRSFGTATVVDGPTGPVDVATARRERYPVPGALPTVTGASILEDLSRRDFTVNAMAISLSPPSFGQLLDPAGGFRDLGHHRIRALHPLSFVEDPTRIFRAVRYAGRLGFRLDRDSLRWLRVALRACPYPALSGQRILAELELIFKEPRPLEIMLTLGRLGVFRLLDPTYRFPGAVAIRLRDLFAFLRWARGRQLQVENLSLALVALTSHLDPSRAETALRRLALSGEPLRRLLSARTTGPGLVKRLTSEGPPSQRARWLRGEGLVTLGWAWLLGAGAVRRQIEWFLAEVKDTRSCLGGKDLLALGVPEGPAVGALLDRLRDAKLDGAAATRDEETALVRSWIGSSTGMAGSAPDNREARASRGD